MVNGTVFCEGIKCPQVECDGDLEYENYMCCPVCKGITVTSHSK